MPLGRRASLPQLFEKIKIRARSKSRTRRKESIDYSSTKAENHEPIDFNLADMRMPTFKGEEDSEPSRLLSPKTQKETNSSFISSSRSLSPQKENLESRERAPEIPFADSKMPVVEKEVPVLPVEPASKEYNKNVKEISDSRSESSSSMTSLKNESYLDYIKRMRSRGPAIVTRRVIQNGTVAARREKFLQKENKCPQVLIGRILSNTELDCDRFSTVFEKDIAQFDDFADDGLEDLFEATDESGSSQLTEQNADNKHKENRFSSDTFSSYASDTVMEV